MESNKKMKHDISSSSSSTKRLSKLEIIRQTDFSLAFAWELPDFPQFNDQYLVSGYFHLFGFHFRLHLFSKGKASEKNSQKHLGLYLEIYAISHGKKGSVCCKVTMLNHIENAAQSVSKYVLRRYIDGMKPNGQTEFSPFGSLQGLDSEFLLNGTDLYVHGDIFILDDDYLFQGFDVPLSQINNQVDSVDTVKGVYEGKFTWTLKNYSLLQERFKHHGMLGSPPFPIGPALYHIYLETRKLPSSSDEDENFLSMFLHKASVEGGDKSVWCVLKVEMRNKMLRKPQKVRSAYGRLESDCRWLHLMTMSKFEDPNIGWYNKEKDIVEFIVQFSALKERVYLTNKFENSKTIWDLGANKKPESNSIQNKNMMKKELFDYRWMILNFSTMADKMNKADMRTNFGIRSRKIRIGEAETHLMIYPWGVTVRPNHIALYIESMNSSKRPTLDDDETSLLVHFALGMNSLTDSWEPRMSEQITRLHKDRKLYGYPDFILQSDFYKESDGDHDSDEPFLVTTKIHDSDEPFPVTAKIQDSDEPFLVTAKIHVVEETLTVYTDGVENNSASKEIRWEVEDFISACCERNRTNPIESSYIEICPGFHLCISIAVCNHDGILYGGLRSDGLPEETCYTHRISIQLAVLNQQNLNETQWKEHSIWMVDNPRFNLGKLSDLLKEGAGYIVQNKVVFVCKIYKFNRFRFVEYRKIKKAEEEARSSRDRT